MESEFKKGPEIQDFANSEFCQFYGFTLGKGLLHFFLSKRAATCFVIKKGCYMFCYQKGMLHVLLSMLKLMAKMPTKALGSWECSNVCDNED